MKKNSTKKVGNLLIERYGNGTFLAAFNHFDGRGKTLEEAVANLCFLMYVRVITLTEDQRKVVDSLRRIGL